MSEEILNELVKEAQQMGLYDQPLAGEHAFAVIKGECCPPPAECSIHQEFLHKIIDERIALALAKGHREFFDAMIKIKRSEPHACYKRENGEYPHLKSTINQEG